MSAFITTVVFIFGLALAIFTTMFAIEKRRFWLYGIPTVYSILVQCIVDSTTGRSPDWVATALFAVALSALGWLVVRFQVERKANKQATPETPK